jgi:tetratricopeptide (TPR) repeat protein
VCRSAADIVVSDFSRTSVRLATALLVALLAFPSVAAAQRESFFSSLLLFYRTLAGVYGDEGSQLSAHLDAMSAALSRWDGEIREWEQQVRLNDPDPQTALQVHAFLASLYTERGRFGDALREFDEDIRIDPRRAAFPRFKGLIHQLAGRADAAADAFRTAWLLDPADPQNAYRLIAFRSAQTTDEDRARALDTLRTVERELVRGVRPGVAAAFVNIRGIIDDAGGGMAFVPAAYARGFSLILTGDLAGGLAALRAAASTDPLAADAAARPETITRGIAALRQGQVAAAIEQLEAAVARAPESSEAHRLLAAACHVQGDVARGIDHLRQAVRLNRRDERSWRALVRILDETGRLAEAEQVVRDAITALPDAGGLRWQLAAFAARQQRTEDADLNLITATDRYVLLAGRGDLLVSIARLARTHLDYAGAITYLEQAIAVAPNNLAAHKALGRAYIDDGREDEGYAELVVALMLDPNDDETRIELGRLHLAAGRATDAVAILEPTVVHDAGNRAAIRALGDALIRAGRTAEGESRLRESEQLQAQAVEEDRRQRTVAILALQAEVRMSERDYPAAIDLWHQVIALQRSVSRFLRLGDALVAVKRFDEAAEAYQTAISLDDASAETHRRLAAVYDALGRPEESARERGSYVSWQLEDLRRRASFAAQ